MVNVTHYTYFNSITIGCTRSIYSNSELKLIHPPRSPLPSCVPTILAGILFFHKNIRFQKYKTRFVISKWHFRVSGWGKIILSAWKVTLLKAQICENHNNAVCTFCRKISTAYHKLWPWPFMIRRIEYLVPEIKSVPRRNMKTADSLNQHSVAPCPMVEVQNASYVTGVDSTSILMQLTVIEA